MRIGLFLGEAGDSEQQIAQIVDAEQDGFDSCWLGQIFQSDAMTVLALAGASTRRIELGTSVIPTYPRHPYVLAQQALTVQRSDWRTIYAGDRPLASAGGREHVGPLCTTDQRATYESTCPSSAR